MYIRSLLLLIVLSITNCPANAKTILAIGDSLTAAYRIDYKQGWVKLLEQRLKQNNYNYQVINAGISGDTTGNGLARFEKNLRRHNPNIVIIGFGSNDGLRGLNLSQMENNLTKMINIANKLNIKILFLGFKVPENYGPTYSKKFAAVFPKLSEKFDLAFVPFMLENVALVPELMLSDNLHPNAHAQPIILNNIWLHLEKLLNKY